MADWHKDKWKNKAETVASETGQELQTMFDAMNNGQKKQIVKVPEVKKLFDRYGVQYG